MPADITAGLYYPWLDYKWGYAVGVPVKNPLLSDVPSLLYPWRSFAIEQLKSLRIPLWSPFYFGGMPALANFQSAVFSWVNIFFVLFPKIKAWSWGIVLQPFLGAVFVCLFLRNRKLDKACSLLGGIVFALSGFSVAFLEYNVHGHTAYFLPLLLFLIDKYFATKEIKWLPGFSLAIAFQVFAGYIPVVIYSYLVIGLYILVFHLKLGQSVQLGKLVLFGILGWGLAAVQLLPGWELVRLSIRSVDPIVRASNASFLSFSHFVTSLAPDFFGNPASHNYWGQAFYDNFAFWVGVPSLILAIVALLKIKSSKFIRFFGGVLLLSFILVIKNPFGIFLNKIFFLEGGVAARALFMTDFSLAVLAGLGLETLLKEKRKVFRHLLATLVLIGGGLGMIGVMGAKIEDSTHRLIALRNLVIPTGFFLLSVPLFLGLILSKRALFRCFSISVLLVLVSANLLYCAKKYLPFSKPGLVFPTTPVVEFLQSQPRPFRFEPNDVIPQNMWMPYGLEAASGSDALLPKRMGEFLTAIETGKIQKNISRVHLIQNYDSPLFRLLNVKYVLAKKKTELGIFSPEGKPPSRFLDKEKYRLVFEDKTVQIYEDLKALPRALWISDFEVIKNDSEIIARLHDPKFDFTQKVILGEDPSFIRSKVKARKQEIEWIDYQPGRLKMAVKSDQPGFVFLANNFYPGWGAYIDGQEAKVYRANYTFQAVKASRGEHILELVYDPPFFKIGLVISALAVGGLLGSSIFLSFFKSAS